MSKFQPFVMERMMSKWENQVDYNLSESGVHPATVRDLVPDPAQVDQLLSTEFVYSQANGIPELRERIAAAWEAEPPERAWVMPPLEALLEEKYLNREWIERF